MQNTQRRIAKTWTLSQARIWYCSVHRHSHSNMLRNRVYMRKFCVKKLSSATVGRTWASVSLTRDNGNVKPQQNCDMISVRYDQWIV